MEDLLGFRKKPVGKEYLRENADHQTRTGQEELE
jgi:hypothetical protein